MNYSGSTVKGAVRLFFLMLRVRLYGIAMRREFVLILSILVLFIIIVIYARSMTYGSAGNAEKEQTLCRSNDIQDNNY